MERVVYVDGCFVPEKSAKVSVFDRGFLFSDAVYEVTAVIDEKLVSWSEHFSRLQQSLADIKIDIPFSEKEILKIHRELIALNEIKEGLVYMQISRGAVDRNFTYPSQGLVPTLVLFTQKKTIIDNIKLDQGLKVLSFPDLRWGRCDIKTVQLLYASLSKQTARDKGKDDAWFMKDHYITEGSSNNAFIISKSRKIMTTSLSRDILGGITRHSILKYARSSGLEVEEVSFSLNDVKEATEAFSSSSTTFIMPVVEIDNTTIGTGIPGPHTRGLRDLYLEEVKKDLV